MRSEHQHSRKSGPTYDQRTTDGLDSIASDSNSRQLGRRPRDATAKPFRALKPFLDAATLLPPVIQSAVFSKDFARLNESFSLPSAPGLDELAFVCVALSVAEATHASGSRVVRGQYARHAAPIWNGSGIQNALPYVVN